MFRFFACVCCVCVRVPEEVYKHMYQDKTMIHGPCCYGDVCLTSESMCVNPLDMAG